MKYVGKTYSGGYEFIGTDENGCEHYCLVREVDCGIFHISSNMIALNDLIRLLHDEVIRKAVKNDTKNENPAEDVK